jgi:hypothetical protein
MPKFYGTPINTINPSTDYMKRAQNDYERSIGRTHPIWDSTENNDIQVGDYFCFVHKKLDRVEIFRVRKVESPEKRPIWWNIREHSHRNVLSLSRNLPEGVPREVTWGYYKERVHYGDSYYLRGTKRLKNLI